MSGWISGGEMGGWMDEWLGWIDGWVDERLDQWAGGWKKELMNEQSSGTSSAHFSLNIRKSKFASCGERSPRVSQQVSGTLSPRSTWVLGTQTGSLRLGQWEKGQLLPRASVRQPPWGQSQGRSSCLLVATAASPTALLCSLLPCSCPDSLGNGLSCCEPSPWAPRDPE